MTKNTGTLPCVHCGADAPRSYNRPARCEPCRFLSFVVKPDDPHACWGWTGARGWYNKLKGQGYAIISWKSKPQRAHRISYELFVGPIPDGMLIDHSCRNPKCTNPAHLRLADNSQNLQNFAGARVDSRLGIRGVYQSSANRWTASVKHRGVMHRSSHDSLEAAEQWARETRNRLFTHNDADRPRGSYEYDQTKQL